MCQSLVKVLRPTGGKPRIWRAGGPAILMRIQPGSPEQRDPQGQEEKWRFRDGGDSGARWGGKAITERKLRKEGAGDEGARQATIVAQRPNGAAAAWRVSSE